MEGNGGAGRTRTGLRSRLARKHLLEEDVASSTEPGRIDYPVSHLNTCSLPFTDFPVYVHSLLCVSRTPVHAIASPEYLIERVHLSKFHRYHRIVLSRVGSFGTSFDPHLA